MKLKAPGNAEETASQKSELYEILFRRVNDAILIFEPETEIILEVSDKACEIYRRRREDFIGRSLKEFSQNVARGSEELEKLLHDGAYDEFESVHLRGDGVPINLVINAAVIVYRGRPAILTINRDVTGKKAIQTALRESEEQFRSVTQSARDAIISADSRGNIVFWNDAAEKMFGYSNSEAVGQSLQLIMPPAHRAAHQKGLERNVETGENRLIGKTVEVPGRRKDGTEFPLELSLGAWESEKGKFFTAVLRDITDRQEAETRLKESERQYRYLAEGINHQVWTSLPDGKLDYVNQKTLEYFGNTMEDALGDGWTNVIHPDDLPACIECWTHSLKTGDDYEIEFRLKRADGTYLWHLGRATAGLDENGKIVKWFGTNTDIDDKKCAESELQKNLSLLNSTFEATADGVLVVSSDNRIEMFNRQFAEMWEMSDEELKNLSSASVPRIVLERLKNPEDFIEKTKQIDVRGAAISLDEMELKNGRIYERHSRPQRLGDRIIGRVFNFRNITERRQVENALRRSQSALDATKDGVFMFAPDTLRFFYVNEGATEQVGYSREELLQMTPVDIKPEFTETEFRRMVAPMIAGTFDSHFFTTVHRHKDGTNIPVEIMLQSVTSADGEKLFVAMVRDITERKRAEKETARLAAIVESSGDAIISKNLDGTIASWNDGAEKLFGYSAAEAVGRHVSLLFPPDRLNEETEIIEKILAGKTIEQFETMRVRRGGEPIPVSITISQIKNAEGEIVGISKIAHDITHRKRAEEKLQESEQRYRLLFESNPNPIFVYDVETFRFLAVNEEAVIHYGYTREEFNRMTLADIRPPEDVQLFKKLAAQADDGRDRFDLVRHRKKDGTIIKVEVAAQNIAFDGRRARFSLITDVTERERAEKALRESEYKLRTLFANMSEGLVQVNNEEVIEFVNDCFCEMTGYSREELLGQVTYDFIYDDEGQKFVREANRGRQKGASSQYELRLRKKGGEKLFAIVGGVPMVDADGEITGTMGVFTDITERKRAEQQLLHDAFHDGLTGLSNRALFMDHLQRAIERGKSRHSNFYAVLFLDFDRFKVINDSLGHIEGDNFLKIAARRIAHSTRTGDVVARLGGDEFVVLLSELAEAGDALLIAGRILEDLKKPFEIGGREIFISASIGIALSSGEYARAEDMLKNADIAMYRAKAKGRDRYQIFDAEMGEQAAKLLSLDTEMRHALERGEFELHYQPIINLETGALTGFESLVRWRHPTRGMIPPFEFIPAAEESNLILPLGKWILEESCRRLREWQEKYLQAQCLTVSVNLSSKQFAQADLTEQVAAALEKAKLAPQCLKLEITESHVMENSEQAIRTMKELRALGVRNQSRRFRHRLLVFELSAPLARQFPENRPLVCNTNDGERRKLGNRFDDHQAGAELENENHRRRHRNRRAARASETLKLRIRSGILFLETARCGKRRAFY